jgi:hypothetical protein
MGRSSGMYTLASDSKKVLTPFTNADKKLAVSGKKCPLLGDQERIRFDSRRGHHLIVFAAPRSVGTAEPA